jgi:Cu+-exporting ATPase
LRKQGHTVMMIGIDGKAARLLSVADPIKSTIFKALADLYQEGFGW